MTIVGTVQGLWRYPVKSMGAEALGQAVLGPMGVPGDRTWALRDEVAAEIRGAAQNLGVYAEVVEPGVVREGDQAVLLDT